MRIDIVTIFPKVFFGPFSESVVGRALKQGLIEIKTVDLRNFTHDKRRTVDDKPYGGGPGMLMKPEPFFEAVESLREENSHVVFPSPQGEVLTQKIVRDLAAKEHLILLSGHYEGIDERVRQALVDQEISIGDYILTNGNIPAMVIVDAVVRLIPGVLGSPASPADESFSDGLLEYPQYTRPEVYRGMKVPEALLSGDHDRIADWRRKESEQRTRTRRPDLLK